MTANYVLLEKITVGVQAHPALHSQESHKLAIPIWLLLVLLDYLRQVLRRWI
jgi:hypothetical protein